MPSSVKIAATASNANGDNIAHRPEAGGRCFPHSWNPGTRRGTVASMNPLVRMLYAGGGALLLLCVPPALQAHIGLAPRLTPTPTAFEARASMISRDDRSFLSKAAMDARRQIANSQAVMDQLSNPQIKSFAQQVIAEATAR